METVKAADVSFLQIDMKEEIERESLRIFCRAFIVWKQLKTKYLKAFTAGSASWKRECN